jgi:hypothetical protein
MYLEEIFMSLYESRLICITRVLEIYGKKQTAPTRFLRPDSDFLLRKLLDLTIFFYI